MISRRRFIQLSALGAVVPMRVLAQPSAKRAFRIGFLSAASEEANASLVKAFHEGMTDLGWREGRDYTLVSRYGAGAHEAMTRAAAELIATRPDVLLAAGDAAIRPLADRTRKIPIVFAAASNPV